MLLRVAGVVNGTSTPLVMGAVLRVAGERSAAVSHADDFGADERTADRGGTWLVPGLITRHGHLRLSRLDQTWSRSTAIPARTSPRSTVRRRP